MRDSKDVSIEGLGLTEKNRAFELWFLPERQVSIVCKIFFV
jgi:phage terminase large subunit-like protein